jgi:hypothetical protein
LRIFRKIILWILVTVTMACVLFPVYVDLTFSYMKPRSPQPDQGRIHRIVINHGSVVYVNEKELRIVNFAFNDIFLIGIIGVGLVGVVQVYWKQGNDG